MQIMDGRLQGLFLKVAIWASEILKGIKSELHLELVYCNSSTTHFISLQHRTCRPLGHYFGHYPLITVRNYHSYEYRGLPSWANLADDYIQRYKGITIEYIPKTGDNAKSLTPFVQQTLQCSDTVNTFLTRVKMSSIVLKYWKGINFTQF